MSKPGFSFGLKKAGPAKPAPGLRKPAPFGGGDDDDGSGDESALSNVAQVSELNIFGSSTSSTAAAAPEARKKPTKKPPLKPGAGLAPSSKPALPQPSSSSSATNPDPSNNPFTDLSSALTSRKHAASAAAADPSIYDYDAAYDSFKAAKAAAAAAGPSDEDGGGGGAKKPRYFSALLNAADVRERDRQVAEERRLQREREAEGDEFADKERFVTDAYRRQQEENKRLREEEEKREEAERKRDAGRGMARFYMGVLERGEKEHAALVKAAEEGVKAKGKEDGGAGSGEKTAAERAKEINARGGNVVVNEDGEVVDKRQLLKGGLNVGSKKKAEVQQERERERQAAAARGSGAGGGAQGKGVYATGGKQAMRERQSRMLEAQLEESLKRSRQEEQEEAAKVELASKTRKTAADISSAKERYLARKRAAEEAKKNGEEDGP